MMKLRNLTVVAIAAITALTITACGDDAASHETTTSTDFNEADVGFAQGMIPHHEQAIEMADIALDPTVGAGNAVRDLATRIKGAQDPEIVLMTGWLESWGEPIHTSGGHEMSSTHGMMSADEMDALGALTGAEFDSMWLTMMIRHHEGAITMAQTVQADGSNADVIALAGQIISAQQAEIDEMRTLL